jgi:hypothetical protein
MGSVMIRSAICKVSLKAVFCVYVYKPNNAAGAQAQCYFWIFLWVKNYRYDDLCLENLKWSDLSCEDYSQMRIIELCKAIIRIIHNSC